jgi:hypothetical protein
LWWANQRYPSQKKIKLNFGSTQLIDMSCIMLTRLQVNYFKVFSFEMMWFCKFLVWIDIHFFLNNFNRWILNFIFLINESGNDFMKKLCEYEFFLIMQDSRKIWKYINIWTPCELIIIDSISNVEPKLWIMCYI